MTKLRTLTAVLHAVGTRFLDGFPEDQDHAKTTAALMLQARDSIEEMQACIRKLCPEAEARKILSFKTAEEIFSEPRRDN